MNHVSAAKDPSNPIALLPTRPSIGKLDRHATDTYWVTVETILRDVFGDRQAAQTVLSAQARLSRAPEDTQVVFYHASPAEVAADLIGRPVTAAEFALAAQKAGPGATS